jgi:hypothetical protein
MGFYIRPTAKGFTVWEETYSDGDRDRKPVPILSYAALGFQPDMTLEEAKTRAKALNLEERVKSKAISKAARRAESKALTHVVYLPQDLQEGFELYLEELTMGSNERLTTLNKHWNVVKKIIVALALEPSQFYEERFKLISLFMKRHYSVDYVKKLRYMLNLWGTFYARKRKVFFEPLPKLTGTQRERIVDSHEDKETVRRPAKGINPVELYQYRDTFKNEELEPQWNWLFISAAFGLRPKETDGLLEQEGKLWKVVNVDGQPALFILQTKLTSIARDKRWKLIPISLPEQSEAFKLIKSGMFKRPLVKSIKLRLGDPYDTYSPRKGFADWLLGLGYDIESIAIFMGHQSLAAFTGDRRFDTTWKHYKDKLKFKTRKVG